MIKLAKGRYQYSKTCRYRVFPIVDPIIDTSLMVATLLHVQTMFLSDIISMLHAEAVRLSTSSLASCSPCLKEYRRTRKGNKR